MSNARSENLNGANQFHNKYYHGFLVSLIVFMVVVLMMVVVVLYQISHRPLPQFVARATNGQRMMLTAFDEPNYLPSTLIKWARKAAVAAYTFSFVDYNSQLALVRPYFTKTGWSDYQSSVSDVLQNIKQAQLFVYGVVSAPPVISNQGELPGLGYTWRIQMPFLVSYVSTETTSKRNLTVKMNIVKIPTQIDPTGLGIEQFVM